MAKGIDDQAGEAAGTALALILIVGSIIMLWLLYKAVELVIRVVVRHPTNRPMWVALGLVGASVIATLATNGHPAAGGALSFSLAATLVTAKAVELYYDPLLVRELTKDDVREMVLHDWWSSEP